MRLGCRRARGVGPFRLVPRRRRRLLLLSTLHRAHHLLELVELDAVRGPLARQHPQNILQLRTIGCEIEEIVECGHELVEAESIGALAVVPVEHGGDGVRVAGDSMWRLPTPIIVCAALVVGLAALIHQGSLIDCRANRPARWRQGHALE